MMRSAKAIHKLNSYTILASLFYFLFSLFVLSGIGNANSMTTTIDAAGHIPFDIEYDPVHEMMYVTNFENEGTISLIDTKTNTMVADPINVGSAPFNIAYDPIHDKMYVTNFGGGGKVSVIDTNTSSVVGIPIILGGKPQGIAYDPVHQQMYVTLNDNSSVAVVDTNNRSMIGKPIHIGGSPQGIAYDPVNQRMYVTNSGGGGTVSVIDTNSSTLLGTPLFIGGMPQGIAYDPVHYRMYVANFVSNDVSVIDTNTNAVRSVPIGGAGGFDLTYDKANGRMYVANALENRVHVLDTETDQVVGNPITVGNSPKGIEYDPVHGRMYVANGLTSSVSVLETLSPSSTTTITAFEDAEGNTINNGSTTASTGISFSFGESSIPGMASKRYECSIDNTPFYNCESPMGYSDLSQGYSHIFSVRPVGNYGNDEVSPTKFVWQITTNEVQLTDLSKSTCTGEIGSYENDVGDAHNTLYDNLRSHLNKMEMGHQTAKCYENGIPFVNEKGWNPAEEIGNSNNTTIETAQDQLAHGKMSNEETRAIYYDNIFHNRTRDEISNCYSTVETLSHLPLGTGETYADCNSELEHSTNSDQQHVSAEARSVLVTPSVPDSELRSSDTSMQTLPLPLPQ